MELGQTEEVVIAVLVPYKHDAHRIVSTEEDGGIHRVASFDEKVFWFSGIRKTQFNRRVSQLERASLR